jgi:uncharacterized protein
MNTNKKQVLVIHGGDFFDTQEEFLQYLRTEKLSKEDLIRSDKKNWRDNLQSDLGEDFEVLQPTMPSKFNAKYIEWKTWFERVVPFLTDGVALVGHSLGGIFLERYFSENTVPVRIGGLFLLAAPYFEDRSEAGFNIVSPKKLLDQVKKIYLYHSKDDPIVPFEHAMKYEKTLPGAELVALDDRGHLYAQDHFHELVRAIRNLAEPS